ncbi:hypothetical protein V1512DRAFT_148184 [Lipomyces arxii]|uniref:uncharacterized protein n=1 Tax=Lipomyces arxii TaxID=56418 RepID=UPI0034CF675A
MPLNIADSPTSSLQLSSVVPDELTDRVTDAELMTVLAKACYLSYVRTLTLKFIYRVTDDGSCEGFDFVLPASMLKHVKSEAEALQRKSHYTELDLGFNTFVRDISAKDFKSRLEQTMKMSVLFDVFMTCCDARIKVPWEACKCVLAFLSLMEGCGRKEEDKVMLNIISGAQKYYSSPNIMPVVKEMAALLDNPLNRFNDEVMTFYDIGNVLMNSISMVSRCVACLWE